MKQQAGFTLIEVLLAMALGCVVIGLSGTLLWTVNRSERAVRGNAQTLLDSTAAFERLRRDVRGIQPKLCNAQANWQLHAAGANVAALERMRSGARIYTPAEAAPGTTRVAGTVALDLYRAEPLYTQWLSQASPAASMVIGSTLDIVAGQFLVDCTPLSVVVWPVTSVMGNEIGHSAVSINGGDAGCDTQFHAGNLCSGAAICLAAGAACVARSLRGSIGRVAGIRWYLADNGRGGKSLYRTKLQVGSMVPIQAVELIEGVSTFNVQAVNRVSDGEISSLRIRINDRESNLRTGL